MKKFIKNNLLGFILGAIIFSGIGAYAEYIITADKVEYSKDISVKDKVDDLYTMFKPVYTGITSVTPTKNIITLETKNMRLNNNIIINAIPSNYKYLAALDNELVASDLLSNIKAYNASGEVITGSNTSNCVHAKFYCDDACKGSQGMVVLNFVPTVYASRFKNTSENNYILDYKNGNSYYIINTTSNSVRNYTNTVGKRFTDFYDTSTGKLIAKNWGSEYGNQYVEFVACK